MGVLPCHRNGCEHIMCDRYSDELGYICNECYDELVSSGEDPEIFMESKKGKFKDRFDYETIFKSRY
jgi:hypothetical protein